MDSTPDLVWLTTDDAARRGFLELMGHVLSLYACGESSSVSETVAYQVAESVIFVLGRGDVDVALAFLRGYDVVGAWTRRRHELEARVPEVMGLWRKALLVAPPIRNIALRDTLAAIGTLPRAYDTFFAAHEVAVDIDYPLSVPVSDALVGLDYVEAWLGQFLAEATFLARFDPGEVVAYLESWCPDHRGLLINLFEPIRDAWQRGLLSMTSRGGGDVAVSP